MVCPEGGLKKSVLYWAGFPGDPWQMIPAQDFCMMGFTSQPTLDPDVAPPADELPLDALLEDPPFDTVVPLLELSDEAPPLAVLLSEEPPAGVFELLLLELPEDEPPIEDSTLGSELPEPSLEQAINPAAIPLQRSSQHESNPRWPR